MLRSGRRRFRYSYPVGQGDTLAILRLLFVEAKAMAMPFVLYGIPAEAVDSLTAAFGDTLLIEANRDTFDYLYLTEELAALKGRKYSARRNHLNAFRRETPAVYEPITPENLPAVREMNERWFQAENDGTETLAMERIAVSSALAHFFEEGLTGGLLRWEGKVIAYTAGSPILDDTFDIHIEKAFSDYRGAYTAMNQTFVQEALLGRYRYVNREDDVGNAGLRAAKLGYRPAMMYERYTATER